QGVTDRLRGGPAVTDDRHSTHSEQRCTPVLGVIEHPEDALELVAAAAHLLELLAQRADDEAGHGFVELEQDVPDEAVAHHHVTGAANDVATLDVPDKLQAFLALQELVGLQRQLVALPGLLTDVEQPYPRPL